MFFYNLSRNGKMSGSAQEIRYINRDENTHLSLIHISFCPNGCEDTEPILLTLDEYEVIRLVDLEQQTHEQLSLIHI